MHKLQEELEASQAKVSALKEALAASNAQNALLQEQLEELRVFNFLLRKEVSQLTQQLKGSSSRRHSLEPVGSETEGSHAFLQLSEPDQSPVQRRSRKSATTKHPASFSLHFVEARQVDKTPPRKPKPSKRNSVGKYVPSFMRKAR